MLFTGGSSVFPMVFVPAFFACSTCRVPVACLLHAADIATPTTTNEKTCHTEADSESFLFAYGHVLCR